MTRGKCPAPSALRPWMSWNTCRGRRPINARNSSCDCATASRRARRANFWRGLSKAPPPASSCAASIFGGPESAVPTVAKARREGATRNRVAHTRDEPSNGSRKCRAPFIPLRQIEARQFVRIWREGELLCVTIGRHIAVQGRPVGLIGDALERQRIGLLAHFRVDRRSALDQPFLHVRIARIVVATALEGARWNRPRGV